MMLPASRVVAIDDEPEHLEGLTQGLNQNGTACLSIHFTGEMATIPPCPHCPGDLRRSPSHRGDSGGVRQGFQYDWESARRYDQAIRPLPHRLVDDVPGTGRWPPCLPEGSPSERTEAVHRTGARQERPSRSPRCCQKSRITCRSHRTDHCGTAADRGAAQLGRAGAGGDSGCRVVHIEQFDPDIIGNSDLRRYEAAASG